MEKVLIANRGEIAVRIIRACRELGLKTVAVHSTADKDSLHAKLADESVCIGPGPSIKSYLHVPAIMSAAEVTASDAIHPGYGFLSERYEFAEICREHGVNFIGPTPENIKALGDKVRARALAVKAGLPLLSGSHGAIGPETDITHLLETLKFPVIIKASAGGGGRGMKIVRSPEEFAPALALAQKEAQACFGNPSCYVEKFLENPKHIEVQLVCDKFGNQVALGERDCSTQRRHQKLVEESPSPSLSAAERATVLGYARALAKECGYQSVGTVEFLYEAGAFYFMEMNTRIQVEHPVTEQVFGVDLIKEQINIARGFPLSERVKKAHSVGHAIECRINAEDAKTFIPWPGKITAYHEPGGPGVRVDSMIYAGYTVPALYDSMIMKLITYGIDREEAIQRMLRSLYEMRIEGIRTNIDFHIDLLQSDAFRSGDISTNYLSRLS